MRAYAVICKDKVVVDFTVFGRSLGTQSFTHLDWTAFRSKLFEAGWLIETSRG